MFALALNSREYEFLKRHKRRFKMGPDDAREALRECGVPLKERFTEFQTLFAGYAPEEEVVYGLVGPDRREQDEVRVETWGSERLVRARIDLENWTQIRMWLVEDGTVCYEQLPVAESFESYLRYSAYLHLVLAPLKWTHIPTSRIETKRFQRLLDSWQEPVETPIVDRHHSIERSSELFWLNFWGSRRLFVRPDLLKGG